MPHLGRIKSSNPCSEFFFVDDSACNLAAVNLVKLFDRKYRPKCPWSLGSVTLSRKVVEIMITAQDILCDMATYPNDRIRDTSIRCRPLGLGFTDLGSYLMLQGVSYDSEAGRQIAGSLMSHLSALAHLASAGLAQRMGPYAEFNPDAHMAVVREHRAAALGGGYGTDVWDQVLDIGVLRNANLTLLAPCGTMGFLLDNVTTGIEPAWSHVTYKRLVGGGTIKLVNRYMEEALTRLGYGPDVYSPDDGTFEVADDHRGVFRTAGEIHWEDHPRMMAAVQPCPAPYPNVSSMIHGYRQRMVWSRWGG